MELLLVVALMAGFFLAVALLRFPPSWLGRVAEGVRRPGRFGDGGRPAAAVKAGKGSDEAVDMTVDWGLFTWSFVRGRLDALAEELERLDRDPDVFAKAFHTTVARSAYEALLVDASRLSTQPWRQVGPTIDFELLGPSGGPREVLEL